MEIGWIVSVPFIARQTDKGMPHYGEGSLSGWRSGSLDRFIYNGGEEIVPVSSPSETAGCEMIIDYEIPYYDVATGEVHSEAVEKFPDEVCGWWYFRTRLEGVEPTVPKGDSFGGRRMDIQVNNDVAVAFGNSVFPSRMLFFESTPFFS